MKLSASQFDTLLSRGFQKAVRSFLFYAEESLFVTEKVQAFVTKALGEELSRVLVLESNAILSRDIFLSEALTERTLFEETKKVLWLQEAPEKILPFLQEYLSAEETQDSFPVLIVTADRYLKPSSKLRQYYEEHPHTFSMGCFAPTLQEIQTKILELLRRNGKEISSPVLKEVSARFLEHPLLIGAEIQKLVDYIGDRTPIELPDLEILTVDDSAGGNVSDVFFKKDLKKTIHCFRRETNEGTSPISILRNLIMEGQRLYGIHCLKQEGHSLDQALLKTIPPVFSGQREKIVSILSKWSSKELEPLLENLMEAEVQAKEMGNIAAVRVERVLFEALRGRLS